MVSDVDEDETDDKIEAVLVVVVITGKYRRSNHCYIFVYSTGKRQ